MVQEHAQRGRNVIVAIHQVHVVENNDARRAGSGEVSWSSSCSTTSGNAACLRSIRSGFIAATGRKHLERSNQTGPEPGGVAVALVQREPRRGDGGFLHPAREQQRLARPSRGNHDRERSGDNVIHQLEEALPADIVLGSARRTQLCSQER